MSRRITAHGMTLSVAGWSRMTGIPPSTIAKRLASGWAPNDAVRPATASQEARAAARAKKRAEREARAATRLIPKRLRPPGPQQYTIGDRALTLRGWSDETGIKLVTLYKRVQAGWAGEELIRSPRSPRGRSAGASGG